MCSKECGVCIREAGWHIFLAVRVKTVPDILRNLGNSPHCSRTVEQMTSLREMQMYPWMAQGLETGGESLGRCSRCFTHCQALLIRRKGWGWKERGKPSSWGISGQGAKAAIAGSNSKGQQPRTLPGLIWVQWQRHSWQGEVSKSHPVAAVARGAVQHEHSPLLMAARSLCPRGSCCHFSPDCSSLPTPSWSYNLSLQARPLALPRRTLHVPTTLSPCGGHTGHCHHH